MYLSGLSDEKGDWWGSMGKMAYIIFNAVINLKWMLLF